MKTTDPATGRSRRRPMLHRLGSMALLSALIAPLLVAGGAAAQTGAFPNRPIVLVVPFPPGSASDIPVRAMAQVAAKTLGQQIVIENKPGTGGTLGPVSVAQGAAPDGYTVSIAPATLWRQPHLQKVNYDPIMDFTYIAGLAAYTFAVVVNADAPWQTLGDMLTYAKANPGKVAMGGTGSNSSGHIASFRLGKLSGADINYIPFKGGAEIAAAMLGNHISGQTDAGWSPLIDSGKGRLLAVFTEKRLAKYPNVPTLREAGYDIVVESPWGLIGPKGMDPKVVKTLEQAFIAALDDPSVRKALDQFDLTSLKWTGETYTATAVRIFTSEKRNLEDMGIKGN